MKRLLFISILFLLYSCNDFKYKNGDITYLHLPQKAMFGRADIDSLLQELACGSDSIKVKVINRFNVIRPDKNLNYYELLFYTNDGSVINLKRERSAYIMENVKAIPEYLLY